MPNLIEQMIEECAQAADRVRDHAASRICNDGSILDYRQKIRKETAETIAAQIRTIRAPGE
jgi:roadblock/LC7 domain-containing protein